MNKIIMLIGAAASGKSTAAPKIAAEHQNAVILSTDKMRAELYGAEHIQGNWPDIEQLLYWHIRTAIIKDQNIILDSTHYKKEYRAKIIKNFAKYSEFSAYFFNYPFTLIYSRNKHRARRVPFDVLAAMYSELSAAPPVLSEGFKSIKKMYAN